MSKLLFLLLELFLIFLNSPCELRIYIVLTSQTLKFFILVTKAISNISLRDTFKIDLLKFSLVYTLIVFSVLRNLSILHHLPFTLLQSERLIIGDHLFSFL